MTELDAEVGDQLLVNFPTMDKNGSLFENDNEISKSHSTRVCEVEKIVRLDQAGYNKVSKSLLDDNPDWAGTGGSTSNDPEFKDVRDREALLKIRKDEAKWQRFLASVVIKVVAVFPAPGTSFRPFYVNAEGHSYARCVGR